MNAGYGTFNSNSFWRKLSWPTLLLILAVSCVLRPGLSAATAPPPSQDPVIRVQSNLVRVPVLVLDSGGSPVVNLQPEDFRVEEDGRAETLERFLRPGSIPIELAMLIDVTRSVKPRFDFEISAAARFVRSVLQPEDRAAVISVGSRPELLLSRTVDLEAVLRSLYTAAPSDGSTAFYDSVVMAAHILRKDAAPDALRVILALSDGEDNNSLGYDFAASIREIQSADCAFYSINPGGPSIRWNKLSSDAQVGLRVLAEQTGGIACDPVQSDDLAAAFTRIAAALRSQYVLEYYASGQDRSVAYHHITVKVPSRSGIDIRARRGYFNPGP
jgi:Ca-activated chloride channel homolog